VRNIKAVPPSELMEILLDVAPVRPVFIWGPPGIGKSALVELFAKSVGMECVTLLGSQIAAEDLIGCPKIDDKYTKFYPPSMIARDNPYCLFLDELNASEFDVQKSFYSLIHDRRVGEYRMPAGSIVIGAGNRASDTALVKPMGSALINRMVHIGLKVSPKEWLDWAGTNSIHRLVFDYIKSKPSHLHSEPPATEEPYSTPRSWHMVSDCLKARKIITPEYISVIASANLSAIHAKGFSAFGKFHDPEKMLRDLIAGERRWPSEPAELDVLHWLVDAFRERVIHDLPADGSRLNTEQKEFAHNSKRLLRQLVDTNFELAQIFVSNKHERLLPTWFLTEIFRDMPRLGKKKNEKKS